MFENLLSLNDTLRKSKDVPYYVGLVVFDKQRGRILLGKRREDGLWTGPGGGAHAHENPKQAVVREAYEEANLKLKPRELKELPTIVAYNGKVCHCFWVDIDSVETQIHSKNDPDKEIPKWSWFDVHQPLPNKLCGNRLITVNNAKMRLFGLRKALFSGEKAICKDCHSALFLEDEFKAGLCTGCLPDDVKKAIVEQPDAGIDLNTTEQSQDELASRNNDWVRIITDTMRGADYGDVPKELMLPKNLRLYISKVDDGVFSGIVRKEDLNSGDNGEVQVQLTKMTPEAMVQALKAREYLPKDEPAKAEIPPAADLKDLAAALKNFKGDLHIHLAKSDVAPEDDKIKKALDTYAHLDLLQALKASNSK